MAEHLTEEQIGLYRQRDGDVQNRQESAAHLAVCPSCLERVLDSEHAALAVDALTEALLPPVEEAPFHLSHAEMKSYAAGFADRADQIICESHVEICEECAEKLRLLAMAQKFVPVASKSRLVTTARLAAAVGLIGVLALAAVLWRLQSAGPTREESAGNGTKENAAAVPAGPLVEATPTPVASPGLSIPAAVAGLKDNNREVRLDSEGSLTGLEGFDESSQKMVQAALAGEGLSKPRVIDELSSPPIKLLGPGPDDSGLEVLGPAGKVITEERPTLRWRPLTGSTSYVVSIFDSNFNPVAQSPPLPGPNWSIAAPLRRGQTYSWEVAATKDGKVITAPVAPAPKAQFRILEADKLNALSKLRRQKPVSHLALGLMYARLGMVSEAEGEFRKLVKENPDSALAKKLLRTVQSWSH